MRPLPLILTAMATLLAATPGFTADNAQQWFEDGARVARAGEQLKPVNGDARNVILFVGDGMGVSTVTAARILQGQRNGGKGEDASLSFERMPYLALSKTYSVDAQTSDSAPTASAMMTGIKTNQGVLGVTQKARYGDCASAKGEGVATLLELSEAMGMATGVVSTARITHATPAATYAHTPNRDWESDADLSAEAKAAGCKDIAAQLVDLPLGDGIEVAMGGGRSYFLPNTVSDPEDAGSSGRRKDGRNLAAEWASKPGAKYVWNKAQFDAIDPRTTRRVLGLFERSHMEYEHDRPNDAGKEPSLAEMTAKAIDLLNASGKKGYFLMVEGGRIDHAHHAGNASRALSDAIALSDAVRVAMQKSSEKDTLIVVTADHSHTMTIGGYPDRGNDILGKVVSGGQLARDNDGKPYTTLSYANGPGARAAGPRPDLTAINTADPDFLQEAIVPMGSETHAAEDVAIYARGPGANAFHGTVEQNVIFHVMAQNEVGVGKFLCTMFGNCGRGGPGPIKPPLMVDDLRAGMARRAAR